MDVFLKSRGSDPSCFGQIRIKGSVPRTRGDFFFFFNFYQNGLQYSSPSFEVQSPGSGFWAKLESETLRRRKVFKLLTISYLKLFDIKERRISMLLCNSEYVSWSVLSKNFTSQTWKLVFNKDKIFFHTCVSGGGGGGPGYLLLSIVNR